MHCYTWCGAYTQFAEDRRGTLEPGMQADIAVLSRDVFAIDAGGDARRQARPDAARRRGHLRPPRRACRLMLRTPLHRLLLAVPVMFGVLLIGFLLMQVVPTDPATVRAGPNATPDVIARSAATSASTSRCMCSSGSISGGCCRATSAPPSSTTCRSAQELGATIGPTLELMFASLFWSIPLGILLGTLAGYWRGSVIDRVDHGAVASRACRCRCSSSAWC